MKHKNFRDNFRRLKNTVTELKNRAADEAELLQFDLGVYTLAAEKEDKWNGSDAQNLLRQDMTQSLHLRMKPKELFLLQNSVTPPT